MQLITLKVKEIVKNLFYNEGSELFKDIFEQHVKRVVKYSKLLAEKLGADIEICELSAWLHDASKTNSRENHYEKSSKLAEKILKELNYPLNKIEIVKYCILAHDKKFNSKRKFIEATIVANADVIAHFERIPELFYIAYNVLKLNKHKGKKWIVEKMNNNWKVLMPEAKELIQDKYDAFNILISND